MLIVSLLLLLVLFALGIDSTDKKEGKIQVRAIRNNRLASLNLPTDAPMHILISGTGKQANTELFRVKFDKSPSGAEFDVCMPVPRAANQPTGQTDPSKTVYVDAEVKKKIFFYYADITDSTTSVYTFDLLEISEDTFQIQRQPGFLYYFIYFQNDPPTNLSLTKSVTINLDEKASKKQHKPSSLSQTSEEQDINLDRVEAISNAFFNAYLKDLPESSIISFLVIREGYVFQNNVFSYVIIVVLVGSDIVFITIYLIVIQRKKRMNDLVTQEKEPLGATKVPVEGAATPAGVEGEVNESVTNLAQ